MDNSAAHGQASGESARQCNDSATQLHSSSNTHEHTEPEFDDLLLDHSVEDMTGSSTLAVVLNGLESEKVGDLGKPGITECRQTNFKNDLTKDRQNSSADRSHSSTKAPLILIPVKSNPKPQQCSRRI
jgi:hypothetical protein